MKDDARYEIHINAPVQGLSIGEKNTLTFNYQSDGETLSQQHPSTVAYPLWNVPFHRNQFFTGREDLLEQIHDKFTKATATGATQPLAISGLGGIGKSQVALEYAYRHRTEYQVVFWTHADSHEALVQDFVILANLLQLPETIDRNQNIIVEAVKSYLGNHEHWLLIFDNVEEPQLLNAFFPPEIKGDILITTRSQAVRPFAQGINVEAMSQEEGVRFLLHRLGSLLPSSQLEQTPTAIRIAAEQVAYEFGGMPLALDQAAAYIEETGCGIQEYLERYRYSHPELLQRRGTLVSDHPDSMTRTLSLALEKIEQISVRAKDILQACALLYPDAIPEEFFIQEATDQVALDEAMRVLRSYSLVHRNSKNKTLSLHRLVQIAVKDGMSKKQQRQSTERLVKVISALFPLPEVELWPTCERFLLHVQALLPMIERWHLVNHETFRLLTNAGDYLYEHAQYAEALRFYHKALPIGKQILGPEHPDIAAVLSNLSVLYQARGDYEQALFFCQQALSIREHVLEWGHPDLAASLNNLAGLYREQEQYAQALRYYRLALAMLERVLGPEDPVVALNLDNLGGVYCTLERYEEALSLLQRALSIRERKLGPKHPDVAKSLNNLAGLYREQERYKEALPLFQRALSIWEQVLGPEHPDVASGLNNLALCYQAQGQKEQALPLYERALSIWSHVVGLEHPATATGLNNLAGFYFEQDQYEVALPLFQKALTILETFLKEDHPKIRDLRQVCTLLLLKMRRLNEQEIIAAFPLPILKTLKQGNKAAFDRELQLLPTLARDIVVEALYALYDLDDAEEITEDK